MKYWPFSLSGTILLAASLFVMGTAVPRGQGYGLYLSLFFLIYLAGSFVHILITVFRFEKDHFQWTVLWNYGPSQGNRKNIALSAPGKSPWGTRYVFTLKGTLSNGSRAVYFKRQSKVFTENIRYELELPLPGLFACRGRLFLSDMFGFFRFPLTEEDHREILYHPPFLREKSFPQPRAAEENEESVKNNPSNPEKVLMRDYQPGDLVRDINWKASSKFSAIYTRISPDQEQTVSRMTLVVRPEGTSQIQEPAASALLLGLKSLSETIFHTLIREKPECHLDVIIGETVYDSREDNFEETCLARISALGRRPAGKLSEIPEGALVLTTVADREIPAFREICGDKVFVCTCAPGGNPDLDYPLLQGNALPLGELLRASLFPGRMENKVKRALRGRPEYTGAVNTEVHR